MDAPRQLFADFQTSIARRRQAEEQLRSLTEADGPEEAQLRQHWESLQKQHESQLQAEEQLYQEVHAQIVNEFAQRAAEAESAYLNTCRQVEGQAASDKGALERKRADSEWVVSSVLDDEASDSPTKEFERFRSNLLKAKDEHAALWNELDESVQTLGEEYRYAPRSFREPPEAPRDQDALQVRFHELIEQGRQEGRRFRDLFLPKLVRGWRGIAMFLVLLVSMSLALYLLVPPGSLGLAGAQLKSQWLLVSCVAGGLSGLLITSVLYTLAAMKQSDHFRQMEEQRNEAGWVHQLWLKAAKDSLDVLQTETEKLQRHYKRQRRMALRKFEDAHDKQLAEMDARRNEELEQLQDRYTQETSELTAERDSALQQLDQAHEQRVQQFTTSGLQSIAEAESAWQASSRERRRRQMEVWSDLKADWEDAWRNLEQGITASLARNSAQFSSWDELGKSDHPFPKHIPTAIRLGDLDVDLRNWEGAVPEDMRLAPGITHHRVPYAAPFPEAASILLEFDSPEGQRTGNTLLQSLLLRLLTLLPPGKIRLTILDPVGLGETFGGFMHLTDFDELLVNRRIWTETHHIEARLADLTEHMENVLQKYLRNEFPTIEAYNESAGEVAEPYHFLVINDFPVKFSEIAGRRLTSIVQSGPRCGVYTLMSVDLQKQLPNNFRMEDLRDRMTRLVWEQGSYRIPEEPLKIWPLKIEQPPNPELFTQIVRRVGEASKDARRVEVDFDRVSPPAAEVWTHDSRSEITVPLGRAGATKLQQLKLGKGTSQHMLVAGKTGSGKSTFLHVLITNLALHYGPEEIHFYLIDFKKGVEFKDYATHRLPHARVIAVESDREFGVSTLQNLDEVLQQRGEMFRRHGVQDIAGYRKKTGRPLARILLVVDEFQEFFVEDDKTSQTAALMLDRLVRQGRAFGMHVILGSQTLGGAYSLARSTLGQVAVRVALQCSEADAHLILSEDNTAARLLTRPGEAIYNDANGMVEGNHPFQIAWITDEERQQALSLIHERAARRGFSFEPPVVFEGNIPSDLKANALLQQAADEFSTRSKPIAEPLVWLGDAVEIAPSTEMKMRRQRGSHLLLVGPDADAALGVMVASASALAAQLVPDQQATSLYYLDGSSAESTDAESWTRLDEILPIASQRIVPSQSGKLVEALSTELKQRQSQSEQNDPPIYVFVYNLSRFRDLRKGEDDFGFGGYGSSEAEKPAEPGKLFADLIAQGPEVGMHFVIWSDSYNNLDRWFSRATLKEFELRIAFQMNASDSSNLIDSPAASRLGTHRALLYRDETGTAEKFRPYGTPPESWLRALRLRMLNGPDSGYATNLEEFSIL